MKVKAKLTSGFTAPGIVFRGGLTYDCEYDGAGLVWLTHAATGRRVGVPISAFSYVLEVIDEDAPIPFVPVNDETRRQAAVAGRQAKKA